MIAKNTEEKSVRTEINAIKPNLKKIGKLSYLKMLILIKKKRKSTKNVN